MSGIGKFKLTDALPRTVSDTPGDTAGGKGKAKEQGKKGTTKTKGLHGQAEGGGAPSRGHGGDAGRGIQQSGRQKAK